MNDFFESQFMTDLKTGKLPDVNIKIDTISIRNLAIALLLVAIIAILLNAVVKKAL